MAEKKKFAEWEIETGNFAIDEKKYDAKQELTKDEFFDLRIKNGGDFAGVIYEPRVKFLKANGYAVTRANLLDVNLSVIKPPKG